MRGFARVLADHGVLGQCMWDAPAAEPVRAELRVLVSEFVDAARRHGMLRKDVTAEDAFALLWTIAALVEAADEAIWQRHIDLLLDSLRGRPPRNLLVGFARVLADHGVLGHCMWDAPAAEPVRSELRVLVGEFVDSAKRHGMLRNDITAEDAFALLWTIAALVEAADEAIWQRHIDLLLDSLRGRPPRNLLAPPVEREQWDEFVHSTRVGVEA